MELTRKQKLALLAILADESRRKGLSSWVQDELNDVEICLRDEICDA